MKKVQNACQVSKRDKIFSFEMKIDKFCLQQSIKCLSFVGVNNENFIFAHNTWPSSCW